MTALSFGANRQHSSAASPPPSLSMQVFQHHSPKEGLRPKNFGIMAGGWLKGIVNLLHVNMTLGSQGT
jgi:hypothetical protein